LSAELTPWLAESKSSQKPAAVVIPIELSATSKASGIIVSEIIARIAPAAIASSQG
jgi:hypothetical protein